MRSKAEDPPGLPFGQRRALLLPRFRAWLWQTNSAANGFVNRTLCTFPSVPFVHCLCSTLEVITVLVGVRHLAASHTVVLVYTEGLSVQGASPIQLGAVLTGAAWVSGCSRI